jgi:PAS domain S-box-containing protein
MAKKRERPASEKSKAELIRINGQLQQELAAQKALTAIAQEQQTSFSQICDRISLMVHAIDQDGFIRYTNQHWLQETGYSPAEVMGQKIETVMTLPATVEAQALFPAQTWPDHCPKAVPAQLRKKDGTVIDVLLDCQNSVDPTGRPISLAIMHNLTAQKQTEQALHRRNRELRLLNQVSQAFISTLDLDSVLMTVLAEVRAALEVVACSAWLLDNERLELVCRQVTDPQSELVRGWRVPLGVGFVGWVAEQGESLNISDVYQDERHFRGVDQQTGLPLRSILSVPLRVKDKVIGVLQAVDATVNRFTEADLALLESLAATASIAIENVRLYEQARRDAETKSMLLNEVNHRVKNNLAAIIGILYAERRHLDGKETSYKTLMTDLINRIQGLGIVHSMLSASEWAPLQLSNLANQIIHSALQGLPPAKLISVEVSPSVVRVTPKQANSLTLVINELTTNSMKYAFNERKPGKITVRIALRDNVVFFEYRDDGPGFSAQVLQTQEYNVGLYLIENIVRNDLQGQVQIANDGGAVTLITFKLGLNN